MSLVYLQWYRVVSLLAVPMNSTCHDTIELHVSCTFVERRWYCNCVDERIVQRSHCRPIAFAVIESMSNSYLNLLTEQMLNEHPDYDALRNNQCK